MIPILPLAIGAGAATVTELLIYLKWTRRRRDLFLRAEDAARRSGKPLLVVGRPRGKAHGCGDFCVDLVGAPECPAQAAADVRDLSLFGDGTFGAAYVGHVLESVGEGFWMAVSELHRVADEVFVAHIPDEALSSLLHPEAFCTIHAAPPEAPYYLYTPHRDGRTFLLEPPRRVGVW